MGETTAIEWTDHTFNPWWGCQKVAPECEHCYAESFAKRVGHGQRLPVIWGPTKTSERKFFSDKHWAEPLKWDREARNLGVRRKVFCASMADVFEDRPELIDPRARLFRLVEATTWLEWLFLTKRPENVQRLAVEVSWFNVWPDNVWLGTTVGTVKRAAPAIEQLLATRGPAVRFISHEPALEVVDFSLWLPSGAFPRSMSPESSPRIDWIIVGGESGPKFRPMDLACVENTVRACVMTDTAVFVKQDSGLKSGLQGRIPDALWKFKQFPTRHPSR